MEYSKNKFACELLDGQIQDDRYRIVDDIIYYKDRIYLVPESTLRKKIIQAAHDSPLSGHQGFLRPTGRSERGSHGRASRGKLCSMYRNVASVSRTRLRTPIQQGYSSHYRFQKRSGKASPWTLFQAFPRSKGEIVYM